MFESCISHILVSWNLDQQILFWALVSFVALWGKILFALLKTFSFTFCSFVFLRKGDIF